MRWFEQAISKRRYHLTQFHRPAMLKLERLHNSGLQPVSEFILWHGFFYRMAAAELKQRKPVRRPDRRVSAAGDQELICYPGAGRAAAELK
ncbi:MAG TPA: hypothetical protein DD414_10395 [Lachnospiraceae bacterium]|nr:hypothetical protein [Lachnospiraceae bacterium]